MYVLWCGSLLLQPFSSCGEWALLLIAVHRLLTAVASLVVEHGFWATWASGVAARGEAQECASWALEHGLNSFRCSRLSCSEGLWDLPGSGSDPCPLQGQADSVTTFRPPGMPASRVFAVACKLLVVACGIGSLTRDGTGPPALRVWSLSHWTTRSLGHQLFGPDRFPAPCPAWAATGLHVTQLGSDL